MSDKLPAPCERFKLNLLTLFDIVNDMYEEGQENGVIESKFNILGLMKLFIKKTPSDYMLKRFITRTYKHWDKIYDKDEDYFKDMGLQLFSMMQDKGVDAFKSEEEIQGDNKLMSSLSGDHVATFKNLLSATYDYEGEEIDIFDDERKGDVWKIMHSFVKISLAYIHESRNKVDGKYTVEFFPEIKVKSSAEKWGVRGL
jgi:hypothetical protein